MALRGHPGRFTFAALAHEWHDRISPIAALTVSARRHHGGLRVRFRQESFNAMHVAGFVRTPTRHLPGDVVPVWDGATVHKGPFIDELERTLPRPCVEGFPGYAPELDPAENARADFKGHDANSLPRTRRDILDELHANRRRVSRSQAKPRSFAWASDMPSPPW